MDGPGFLLSLFVAAVLTQNTFCFIRNNAGSANQATNPMFARAMALLAQRMKGMGGQSANTNAGIGGAPNGILNTAATNGGLFNSAAMGTAQNQGMFSRAGMGGAANGGGMFSGSGRRTLQNLALGNAVLASDRAKKMAVVTGLSKPCIQNDPILKMLLMDYLDMPLEAAMLASSSSGGSPISPVIYRAISTLDHIRKMQALRKSRSQCAMSNPAIGAVLTDIADIPVAAMAFV